MSGVCPNCVAYREGGDFCTECGTRLLSPAEWKAQRTYWMTQSKPQESVPQAPTMPRYSVEDKKEFVLGFFFSALLFFFAFLSSFLIFGDKIHF